MSKPLITFALFAYNQEKLVRAAVIGALAQTYEPLEIILSDDGSTDATFYVMQELARSYDGRSKIILNRNARNLGIGAHVNRVMDISSGQLIVCAAGDDISMPERTENIYQCWERLGRPKGSIYSAYHAIDEYGHVTHCNEQIPLPKYSKNLFRMMEQGCPGVVGATHAWHRSLFEKFGPLPDDLIVEDRAISARALLCGGVYYIKEPLAYYRKVWGSNRAARIKEREYYNWVHSGIMKSIAADCRKAGWTERQVRKLEARFLNRVEARWKADAEKLVYIPFVIGSMVSGRMRLSSGFALFPPYFLRIYRFLMRGLRLRHP